MFCLASCWLTVVGWQADKIIERDRRKIRRKTILFILYSLLDGLKFAKFGFNLLNAENNSHVVKPLILGLWFLELWSPDSHSDSNKVVPGKIHAAFLGINQKTGFYGIGPVQRKIFSDLFYLRKNLRVFTLL